MAGPSGQLSWITGRIRAGARPERVLTRSGEPVTETMTMTLEPKGKLDTMAVQAADAAQAVPVVAGVVNGPEDGSPGWDAVGWRLTADG